MVDIPGIPGPAQYIAPSLDDIRKIIRPVTAMVSCFITMFLYLIFGLLLTERTVETQASNSIRFKRHLQQKKSLDLYCSSSTQNRLNVHNTNSFNTKTE